MDTIQGQETKSQEDDRIFQKGKSVTEMWANDYADPFVCSQDWPY